MAKYEHCFIDPAALPMWQANDGSRENQPIITKDSVGSELLCSGMWWLHPGQASAPDIHPDADELYYVVSGSGKLVFEEDEEHEVSKGMSIYIPRNVKHQTFNTSGEDLCYYWVFAPPPTGSAKQDLENWTRIDPKS